MKHTSFSHREEIIKLRCTIQLVDRLVISRLSHVLSSAVDEGMTQFSRIGCKTNARKSRETAGTEASLQAKTRFRYQLQVSHWLVCCHRPRGVIIVTAAISRDRFNVSPLVGPAALIWLQLRHHLRMDAEAHAIAGSGAMFYEIDLNANPEVTSITINIRVAIACLMSCLSSLLWKGIACTLQSCVDSFTHKEGRRNARRMAKLRNTWIPCSTRCSCESEFICHHYSQKRAHTNVLT